MRLAVVITKAAPSPFPGRHTTEVAKIGRRPLSGMPQGSGGPLPTSLHEDINRGSWESYSERSSDADVKNHGLGQGRSRRNLRGSQQINRQKLKDSVILARFGLQESR